MPAAAVIPAPIAYIKVVAVKKLVVGLVCACILRSLPKRVVRHAVQVPSNLQLNRAWASLSGHCHSVDHLL